MYSEAVDLLIIILAFQNECNENEKILLRVRFWITSKCCMGCWKSISQNWLKIGIDVPDYMSNTMFY
jgi:hypothetical protein